MSGNSIYYGIKTGCNEAFIVNTAVRDRLISEDPSSERILKPILRGRDITRYRTNWANRWLISTFPSLNLNIGDFPAVKQHLVGFGKERLEQEGRILPNGGRSRKQTPHQWYELQDTCAYHEKFSTIKLLWRDMADTGHFTYSDDEIYTNDKAFMMTGRHLKYLCGFLNSAVVGWYVQKTALTTGMGLTQWKKYVVESIPVPRPGHWERPIVALVDAVLRGEITESIATDSIDRLALVAYDLTDSDLKLISRYTNE